MIAISHGGYIKRMPSRSTADSGAAARAYVGMGTKEEDFVEHLFMASTHDYILFFTNMGKCHWIKVHELPEGGRYAKGKSIVNLLETGGEDRVTAFVSTKGFPEDKFLIMATREGHHQEDRAHRPFPTQEGRDHSHHPR